MQNKPTSTSHNKIVFALVFACAAIMASLFVFRMSHKQDMPTVAASSTDNMLVFPAPRDIKAFELSTATNTPFTQNNLRGHWTLLFFGFTHCSNVCPTTMDLFSKVYPQLKSTIPNLQVVLISLDPERDDRAALSKYVQSYHPDFIGVSGKVEDLRKFQSQLGVYSALDNPQSGNYQIQHTSSIMLINPDGKWAAMMKFGMKPDELVRAVSQVSG